jgi:hypothetical protein
MIGRPVLDARTGLPGTGVAGFGLLAGMWSSLVLAFRFPKR